MAGLEEIWRGDHLERRDDAEWLATFLRNRSAELAKRKEERSYVLNLDAQWGAGKTFFLTRFQRQLEDAGHLAVYVNAWRDDFADDPLVAVMAAIDKTVEAHREELSPEAEAKWQTVKEKTGQIARLAGKGLLKRGLGFIITTGAAEAVEAVFVDANIEAEQKAKGAGKAAVAALLEGIDTVIDSRAEEEVSDFRTQQVSIQTFRDNLAEFVVTVEQKQGKAAPFFILIDELDRCRPPYAIAMLERIKHLFETPGVVFVVATNSRQLGHSIKAVYGADFESTRYLRRFFDQTYEFAEPRLDAFVHYMMSRSPINLKKLSSPWQDEHAAFLTNFLATSDTDLRTAEQVYGHLHSLASAWEELVPIEIALALPLILAFAHRDPITEVLEALKTYASKNWSLSWQAINPHDGREETKYESIHGLAVKLYQGSRKTLYEASEPKPDQGYSDQWVSKRFSAEFRGRIGERRDRLNPTVSLLREYPQRIRQAGRIKMAADDPDDPKPQ